MEKQEKRIPRETLVRMVVGKVVRGKLETQIFPQLDKLTAYINGNLSQEEFEQEMPLLSNISFEDAKWIHLKVYTSLSQKIKEEKIDFLVMYRIYDAMKRLRPEQRISNAKSFELSICKSLYKVNSHKDLRATLKAMHLIDTYTWDKRNP